MKARVSVTSTFSASHNVPKHTICGKGDGHDWSVRATVEGELNPKTGMVVDHGEFAEALRMVCSEFDHRDLNDMLVGVVPTPEGLAAYIRERLIFAFPNVVNVEVRMGTYTAELEWQLR